MPRTYTKKKSPPSYTLQDITNAVADVKSNNKSYRDAESYYGVPKSVIYQRIAGRKTSLNVKGAGRFQALSPSIEKEIVQCLLERSKMGLPCDKTELRQLVGEYVKDNNLKTPFKNSIPGEDWYYSFMKRYPELSLKKPEPLQKLRKDARKTEIVYGFYEMLKNIIDKHNLDGDRACFVFNADESGFNSDPNRIRAIGLKGKPLNRVCGGSGRESTTVLACVSADGKALPPLIVFKGAAVQARWISQNAYKGTMYAASGHGWMEEPHFFQWFTTCFIPHIEQLRTSLNLPQQTGLLLYDGHGSHISIRIIEEAIKHNITLIKLPSHLTDKLQPLDKCVFGPVKLNWNRHLVKFGKEQIGKSCGRLTKEKFTEILGIVWQESMLSKNIISGFVSTGIYPVDSKKFPLDEFTPEDLEKYQTSCNRHTQFDNTTSNADVSKFVSIGRVENIPAITSNFETINEVIISDTNIPPISHILKTPPNCPSTSSEPRIGNSITNIFIPKANTLPNTSTSQAERPIIPRLKQQAYGEVLTTSKVLARLKEAEEKKRKSNTKVSLKNIGMKQKSKSKKIKKNNDENEIRTNEDRSYEDAKCEDIDLRKASISEIKQGDFILVQFKGGKRNTTLFKYVCVIETLDENQKGMQVSILKSMDTSNIIFSTTGSVVRNITFNEILGILPDPRIQLKSQKILYKFSGKVPVYEDTSF